MKKSHLIYQILYYLLTYAVYFGGLLFSALFVQATLPSVGLTGLVVILYLLFLHGIPIVVIVMMRFSLLKWYIDPFAASIAPLWFYSMVLFSKLDKCGDIGAAIANANKSMSVGNPDGWFVMVVLFLVGLIASFSPARKRGESLGYRLLALITKK